MISSLPFCATIEFEFWIADQTAIVVDDEGDAVFADALTGEEFRQRSERDVDADRTDGGAGIGRNPVRQCQPWLTCAEEDVGIRNR